MCYKLGCDPHYHQRELRNDSGEIMRALDRGEDFVVTRQGVPVGELRPVRRRRVVPRDVLLAAVAGPSPVESRRFRDDVDSVVERLIEPRG
jgi:antitoxin (DNA-binding transcriptional repressor) of toxin-antitoxin stability system